MPACPAAEPSPSLHSGGQFVLTQWSLVVRAGERDNPGGAAALEKLCQTYWPAIYGFLRRKGHSPADAEDLTQEFFAALLRRGSISTADSSRGRFRTFLLHSLTNFLHDVHDRATAAKRGGGHMVVALDTEEAERRYLETPSGDLSPEQLFDRRWAATLLHAAIHQLAAEHEAAGKSALFATLRPFLTEQPAAGDYEAAAAALSMKPNSVAATVRRLRLRCRELLLSQLQQTLGDPSGAEEEFRCLFG